MPVNSVRETREKWIDPTGVANLFVVYIFWSTTYLAIRLVVREGAGFGPFAAGILRMFLAAPILIAWMRLRKERIKLERREWLVVAASGLLLWTGGNGMVMVGEMRADSGIAALTVAAAPIWVALIESVLDRRMPSLQLLLSLLVGFVGIVFISMPTLRSGVRADVIAVLALIAASFCWAAGSIVQSRNPLDLSPQVNSGYQHLFGGVGFLLLYWFTAEALPSPTAEAWWAILYLVLIGSVLTFTAFIQALRLLPTSLAMTYAYVNPVLAVGLGALVLKEEISVWMLSGALMVLISVASIFRQRARHNAAMRAAVEAEPVP